MKRKTKKSRYNPLVQIGAPRDTVKVLATLERRLEQAILLGREATAQEIAKQIGNLGGVTGLTIQGSTFNG